jgi:hypothetical protein
MFPRGDFHNQGKSEASSVVDEAKMMDKLLRGNYYIYMDVRHTRDTQHRVLRLNLKSSPREYLPASTQKRKLAVLV